MINKTMIKCSSGNYFDLSKPFDYPFNIAEIAHALSQICRFTGHTKEFYSVAQHSVLVSLFVPKELRFAALLHDAHEAFIGDISTPLKRTFGIEFLEWENDVEGDIRYSIEAFFDVKTIDPKIQHADLQVLGMEKRDLFIRDDIEWESLKGIEIPSIKITPLSPYESKILFLNQFDSYFKEKYDPCNSPQTI